MKFYLDFIKKIVIKINYILLDVIDNVVITYSGDVHVEIWDFSIFPAPITVIAAEDATLGIAFQLDIWIRFIITTSQE